MDGRFTRDKSTYFRKDLTGKKFGYLTVICDVGRNKSGNILWECKCDCGNKKIVPGGKLTSGRATNCGCMTKSIKSKSASKHGLTAGGKPRTFIIWNGMKARCYNEKSISYKSYGARGISICDEWLSFENFHNWAIKNGYEDNLEIDRIDNDKGYSPDNCRWVSSHFNRMHQRNFRNIEILGITLNISQWCRECNVSKSTAYKLLKKSNEDFVDYFENKILTGKGQQYFINKFLSKAA